MNQKQLVRMIAFVVREELKKQLPKLVEGVLTEQYLKRIVKEQHVLPVIPTRKPHVRVTEDTSFEDEVPEAEESEHDGIYHEWQPNTKGKIPTNEVVRRLLSRENELSFLYEGVQPAPPETSTAAGDVAPPIEKLAKAGLDFEKMKRLAGTTRQTPPPQEAPVPKRFDPTLDTPVGGGAPRPPDQNSWLSAQSRQDAMRHTAPPTRTPPPAYSPDSAAFPDKPISFDE